MRYLSPLILNIILRTGATLSWTQEFTASLHVILNQIKSHLNLDRIRILDIPCGDMAWMSK